MPSLTRDHGDHAVIALVLWGGPGEQDVELFAARRITPTASVDARHQRAVSVLGKRRAHITALKLPKSTRIAGQPQPMLGITAGSASACALDARQKIAVADPPGVATGDRILHARGRRVELAGLGLISIYDEPKPLDTADAAAWLERLHDAIIASLRGERQICAVYGDHRRASAAWTDDLDPMRRVWDVYKLRWVDLQDHPS